MEVSKKHLKAFYEKDAERFWDPKGGLTGRDLVVYPLLNGTSGSVLEYGCGAGSLLLTLARESRFTKCIGVDISEAALSSISASWREMSGSERGPSSLINKVQLLVSQEDKLPQVPGSSVDVILALAVLEHVIDPYVVLDELYRIAKRTALLVAAVPNYGYIKHILQLLLNIQPITGGDSPVQEWRKTGWDGMHLHTFVQSSFETLLKDCGWIPQRWTGWGSRFRAVGFGRLRRRFPRLFSGELIAVCRKRSF